MEAQQQRGRSPSAGHLPQNRIRHSPSPHRFNGQSLDPSFHTPDYSSGDFSSHTLPNAGAPLPYTAPTYMNGNTQQLPFQQHVLPSNDFSDPSLGQSYQPGSRSHSRRASLLNAEQSNQFNPHILDSNPPNDFGDFCQQVDFAAKQTLPFENAFSLDPQLQANMQAHHPSINPADIMSNMSSPQNMNTTPPNLMPPDASSGHGSPSSAQAQTFSPEHSRHASLDPSSAQFPNGQQPTDWSGMLSGVQFQGHRRAPSEHSDVSSSVAPSPYLAQHDSFEAFDQGHSPMLNAQQDPQLYHDALGIESFSLSDPQQQVHSHQQQQPEHISPRHSPYPSPRMTPHPGFGMPQEKFVLSTEMQQNNFNGQQGPGIYASPPNQSFPHFAMRHDSGDMGQAAQMAPPEINVELAPPARQPNFEHLRPEADIDGLSPPERGRRNRMRAKSDPYITRPMTPTSPLSSNEGDIPAHRDRDRNHRSLSPFDISFTGNSSSRDASPASKSRRSSTSSIPNRDYILELADPTRPSVSGETRKVQKHPATFQCTLCPKRFTRAYNLRSHLRTHTDERPFVCTVCGKAFARQHDRKRHEGLHSGEKKFVCRGELGTGGSWGCGRRFARADALGRHFRSEAGRICIKPLLDEEAMERQRQYDESMMMTQQGGASPMHHNPTANGGGFTLPAALLAQYPALQGLQWDNMAGNEKDDWSEQDISGRSSFDAGGSVSGAESYLEDEEGYVSGPGVGSGPGGWDGGRVGLDWASDYEGR